MANSFASDPVLNLVNLANLPPPSSPADAIALTAVAVASAAYLLRGIVWDRPDPYHHVWFERPKLRDGAAAGGAKATRNIAQRLEQSGKDVVVFSGSQSGTAETFAHRLAKECHLRFGLQTLAADLSDYDAATTALLPQTKLAIFILSTYGEGDPSDNTSAFWEWLTRHTAEKIALPNLRYMAFGLGNSNYRHYNRVVDVVVEALDRAGAQRLMPVGRADDANGGTEEDFLAWKDSVYRVFQSQLGLQERDVPCTPSLTIVEDESLSLIDLNLGEPIQHRSRSAKMIKAYSPIRPLTVQSAHELYTSPSRNCLHMELDIAQHPELRYRTGDHLAVYPINPEFEVALLLKAVGLEERADKPLLIQPVEKGEGTKIPSPTTLSALFRHYLEICGPVSRETVNSLSKFAPTEEASTLLLSLGKSNDAYAEFVSKNHVTMSRLLSLAAPEAVWKNLPLPFLIENIPLIQPRYYSISSSSVVTAKRVAITAGVDITPLPADSFKQIHGITTNYLYSLANSLNSNSSPIHPDLPIYQLSGPNDALAGHKVYACIRRSSFKLPTLSSIPLIMIGAGTGIAPFRGFILERARLKAIGKPIGRMLLFFGCRRPDEDFLYKEELTETAAATDGLLEIIPAFSRAQGVPKTYVQDLVGGMGKDVCRILKDGANLYICGRASMAREVGKAVEELMKTENDWSDSEARNWAESIKKGGKWSEDVWG